MKEINFEKNYITRWREYKRQYQENFWEELHSNILKDVKSVIEDQLQEDFEEQIGAAKYERTEARNAERLGRRFRTLETEYGFISEIEVPRARNFSVRFSIFDRWQRIQKKVLEAMLEAYLLGKSSNAASEIVHKFGQSRYSRSFFQKLAKQLESSLEKWLQRPITKQYPYVFIDGMRVKMYDGYLKKKVVIWALGMDKDLKTEALGYIVANSENEQAVRSLIIDLKNRGLAMPKLFISDESGGIEAGLALEYPHVPHQICAFHKMKNIQKYLRNKKNRKSILKDATNIYEKARTKRDALRLLQNFRKKWRHKETEAVRCFARGFEKTLRYFDFPEAHRKSLYTSNPIESFIAKIRGWTTKFNYFEGKANLDLALFSYFYSKSGECVLNMNLQPEEQGKNQIPTLLVA